MTRKKAGLGAGLLGRGRGSDVGRLLGQGKPGAALREVPVGKLTRSPWQPRVKMDHRELRTLADSIEEQGILEPLLAREVNGSLELLAGERRLQAAKLAKLRTVPVRVLPDVDDTAARAIALTENLAREDLSPWEEAQAFGALRNALREQGRPAGVRDLARQTGRSTGAVSESLQIAELVTPDVAKLAGASVQTLNTLPKEALKGIVKAGPKLDARAAVLRAAAESDAPGKTARAATKRGRKRSPFTLTVRSGGPVSLRVAKPVNRLKPEDARELLKRLAPILAQLRERARGGS